MSAEVAADAGGWGEPRVVQGAVVEEAVRGRRGSGWRRGEASRWPCQRESLPF